MRLRFGVPIIACLFMALALPATAAPQTAAQILETAMAQHEARARGIDNYTVTQRVMGVETRTYFEKAQVDGRTVFRSRTVGGGAPDGVGEWDDPYEGLAEFASRASVRGTETIDGHRTHVLFVDDAAGLPGMDPMPGQDFEVRTMNLYIDAADHVIRRMTMEGAANVDGQTRPVTTVMDFRDYRDVQGMLIPYRTVLKVDGVSNAASPEDMARARQGLQELRTQLARMPEAQREMIERQMAPQIEQMEAMLEGGAMEFAVEVVDVQVNTGPPGR